MILFYQIVQINNAKANISAKQSEDNNFISFQITYSHESV